MGTVFYIGDIKIGRRSGAGAYCWGCKKTLIKKGYNPITKETVYGEDAIHCAMVVYNNCPICGKPNRKKTGFWENDVGTCCSFTWYINPEYFYQLVNKGYKIKNEYGDYFSLKRFERLLLDCPFLFHNFDEEIEIYR